MTRQNIFINSLITITLLSSCKGQTSINETKNMQMDNYELSRETSHPKAKQILTDDFFWSSIEESGPFGNDDGSDTFSGFRQWRMANKNASPLKFLEELFISWNYPKFNLNELDTTKIRAYISSETLVDNAEIKEQMTTMMEHFKEKAKEEGKEFNEKQFKEMMAATSNNMGGTYLLGQDNAVISVGFGQFVLEGKIDEEIKTLTKTAINRELLPILIDRWDNPYRKIRIDQLTKMLAALNKMN
jgi:uncharacterized protein YfeS